MSPETIHVVFKTHLDLGFTDQAEAVRRLYHERFIPQALATAEHFWREDPSDPKFVWTTGAWLIHDHLATGSPAQADRLERAIGRGLIRWHGLPFTTHSELMSPALFRAGLSFSAELDRRFGVTTRATKMTDVPGHTLGIVPLMARAGLRFLHIGVNSASPVPEVPDVFLWRAPDGAEIVVMYQASYGDTHLPAGMTEALSFAHTEDNIGPQSVPQVAQALRDLARSHPNARLRAATLEDYGALLWDRRERLPVVTEEIGDSWIHGAGSDPQKLARFRTLQRLYDSFEAEGLTAERLAFGRALTLVAEHTWGVDIKSYLRGDSAWGRPAFEAARARDPRFAFSEASWTEQRAYLDAALARLDDADRHRAESALTPLTAPVRIAVAMADTDHAVGRWTVGIDAVTGDIRGLTVTGAPPVEGRAGRLLAFRHLSFDAADIERHLDTYLTARPGWALLDHGKPGLERARTARSETATPRLEGVGRDGDTLVIRASLPEEAHVERGAPPEIEWQLADGAEGLHLALVLRGKVASRLPEAGVLDLTPAGATRWDLLKTGLWIDPARTARRGGGALHAAFAARSRIAGRDLVVTPLDTALVGAAGADLMRFEAEPPDYSAGLRLHLYNNKWGTNFPQWWEGDLVSRLGLDLRAPG
jgi:Domain of unknown function (DUF5054)